MRRRTRDSGNGETDSGEKKPMGRRVEPGGEGRATTGYTEGRERAFLLVPFGFSGTRERETETEREREKRRETL